MSSQIHAACTTTDADVGDVHHPTDVSMMWHDGVSIKHDNAKKGRHVVATRDIEEGARVTQRVSWPSAFHRSCVSRTSPTL